MQVQPISAPPAATSTDPVMAAALYRPLRLNFAQVCLYCGSRWCESPRCVAQHERSVWAPCEFCDGFAALEGCTHCVHGVVEVDAEGLAERLAQVLPVEVEERVSYVRAGVAW